MIYFYRIFQNNFNYSIFFRFIEKKKHNFFFSNLQKCREQLLHKGVRAAGGHLDKALRLGGGATSVSRCPSSGEFWPNIPHVQCVILIPQSFGPKFGI